MVSRSGLTVFCVSLLLALVGAWRFPAAQDGPGRENPTAPFMCRDIVVAQTGYAERGGQWWIGNGGEALLAVGSSREDAILAARRLNDLRVDYHCYIELRNGHRFQLWLVEGQLPEVAARADNCTLVNLEDLDLSRVDGGWRIDGLKYPQDAYDSQSDAEAVLGAIRRTEARAQCVTRDQSRFHYLVR